MAKITIGAIVLLGVAAAVVSTYFAPAYALNPFWPLWDVMRITAEMLAARPTWLPGAVGVSIAIAVVGYLIYLHFEHRN
jgi:hypothetical protein